MTHHTNEKRGSNLPGIEPSIKLNKDGVLGHGRTRPISPVRLPVLLASCLMLYFFASPVFVFETPANGEAVTRSRRSGAPVLVTSPKQGETISGERIHVGLVVSPTIGPRSVQVAVDGIDISEDFSRPTVCGTYECEETATVGIGDGIAHGNHTIVVQIETPGEIPYTHSVSFRWEPKITVASTVRLPATIGLTTTGPGGRSPWIAISNNALGGTTTYFPRDGDTPCGTQGKIYQVLALNRKTLEEVSYTCYNDGASLKQALAGFNATQIVIAGTSWFKNADAQLDTTPIGGTSYTINPLTGGYMIIGKGKAPAGEATETFQPPTEPGQIYNVKLNGTLAIDRNGNYNFHPSDNLLYSVTRQSGIPVINVGGRTYQSPNQTDNGFWVLKLTRSLLEDPEASSDGCKSGDGGKTWTSCGVFYNTGSTDAQTSQLAAAQLSKSLTKPDPRHLIFLVSTGANQPVTSKSTGVADVGRAMDALGGAGSTLYSLMKPGVAYTLISSSDSNFKKSVVQGGNAVVSSSTYTSQGQTGSVYGVLARDLKGLYRTVDSVQGEATAKDASDLTMFQLAWAQPGPWPAMDTEGRTNAYRYLSNYIIKLAITSAGDDLDDVRAWYTNALNSLIARKKADVSLAPYPPNGQWTFEGHAYTFSQEDLETEKTQLSLELGYLDQCIAYLGNAATGGGLGGAIAGSNSSAALNLIEAASSAAADLKVAQATRIGINSSAVLNLASTLTSIGSLTGVAPAPLLGVFEGMLWVVNAAGTPDGRDGIPSPDYTLLTTVAKLSATQTEYISAQQHNYNKVVNAILSDWTKLSTVGKNITSKWAIKDYTAWNNLLPANDRAASLYFNTQIGGELYSTSLFVTKAEKPWLQGSWRFKYAGELSFYQCTALFPNPGVTSSWQVYPSNYTVGSNDLVIMTGQVKYNNDPSMSITLPSQTYVDRLFGSGTKSFSLPADLVFAPFGPFPRRTELPDYGAGSCPTIGARK